MGLFDENEKMDNLDDEVIEASNKKNQKAVVCFDGWVRKDSTSYVLAKDGSLKVCPKSESYEVRLTSKKSVYNSTHISLEISSLSTYKDVHGLQRYKINRPSLPVIIVRNQEIPDTFIFDVPAGTKEVTFVSFREIPLTKLPKVKGNVKINYINRSTSVDVAKNEKININKWWNGDYESTIISGSKTTNK